MTKNQTENLIDQLIDRIQEDIQVELAEDGDEKDESSYSIAVDRIINYLESLR